MIKASVTVSSHLMMDMEQDELKSYVLSQLSAEISKEVSKKMTITTSKNILNDTVTYTGTLPMTSTNTVTVGVGTVQGYNGTSNAYSQINLRVVEYTKNGKVTRVELQRYNEDGDWLKIPRIQIEE